MTWTHARKTWPCAGSGFNDVALTPPDDLATRPQWPQSRDQRAASTIWSFLLDRLYIHRAHTPRLTRLWPQPFGALCWTLRSSMRSHPCALPVFPSRFSMRSLELALPGDRPLMDSERGAGIHQWHPHSRIEESKAHTQTGSKAKTFTQRAVRGHASALDREQG